MPEPFTLVTWNVLHRIHADNWREPAIGQHPDEATRIASITAWIAARVGRVAIHLLQEVSGDQLASLRAAVRAPAQVLSAPYPRVPRPRAGPTPLVDPTEHLVAVTAGAARTLHAEAFADDPGKGFLAIEHAGVVALSVHLSAGARHRGQWARLAEHARTYPGVVVIGGDFNADHATAVAQLGPAFAVSPVPAASRPTRPRAAPSDKSQTIDHVAVRGAAATVTVVDGEGRSDHNPVEARIDPDAGG
ncbi:MAG: endonuclease/exonuclease/phosphatase family protein [Myxococcota bacterium]